MAYVRGIAEWTFLWLYHYIAPLMPASIGLQAEFDVSDISLEAEV